MSWHTKAGLLTCLALVAVFSMLLAKVRPAPLPGESVALGPGSGLNAEQRHDDAGPITLWLRQAPPLTAETGDTERKAETDEPVPGVSPEESSAAPERTSTYTVQKGDTLSGISARLYGKGGPELIQLILRHNPDVVKDRIFAGQKLVIPPLTDDDRGDSDPAGRRRQRRGGQAR